MKTYFIVCILLATSSVVYAQKAPLDTSAFREWSSLDNVKLSNDGNYCFYPLINESKNECRLFVQSTNRKWKREITGMSYMNIMDVHFTEDSKRLVCLQAGDTLSVLELGTDVIMSLPGVASYKISTRTPEVIAYKQLQSDTLILFNARSGQRRKIGGVVHYDFFNNDDYLFLWRKAEQHRMIARLEHIRNVQKSRTIFSGSHPGEVPQTAFDKRNNRLAFFLTDTTGRSSRYMIYHFSMEDTVAMPCNDINDKLEAVNLELRSISRFSEDGNYLIIELGKKEQPLRKWDSIFTGVDIWNYQDDKLQSQQMLEPDREAVITAALNLLAGQLVLLNRENETVAGIKNNHALIVATKGKCDFRRTAETYWNERCNRSAYLRSLDNGSEALIKSDTKAFFDFSTSGRYIIYNEREGKNLVCFNIQTNRKCIITASMQKDWMPYGYDIPDTAYVPWAVVGWIKNDEFVLVRDRNDIWMLDPEGAKKPYCITNGYGRRNNFIFDLAPKHDRSVPIDKQATLLLTAFNTVTKDGGFFKKAMSDKGDPLMLSSGPYQYALNGMTAQLTKSKNANVYVLTRQATTEFPNLYVTNDFRKFTALTDNKPHVSYNWMTSELITWQSHSNDTLQGVLYKPEDFDPQKKYPVIFVYYEMRSQELNMYHFPKFSGAEINIPWYVSNGYLVFTPDIHFKTGETGASALDAVVSGAEKLSTLPCVDTKKMGINGFSFGGFITYYIVTHTNIFAAASAGSGPSNLIMQFGYLRDNAISSQEYYEWGQGRMGAPLWETPERYINNSPVFQVDRVTTPLLMMHTTMDGAISEDEPIAFFTSLRRLKKKSWLLLYDKQSHDLKGKAAEDYSIRQKQFFDHYLKGAPAPVWMTRGVPTKLKGAESGLELDYSHNE